MLSTTDVPTGEDTLSGNWTLCIRQSVITSRVISDPMVLIEGRHAQRMRSPVGGFGARYRKGGPADSTLFSSSNDQSTKEAHPSF